MASTQVAALALDFAVAWPDRPPAASGERGRSARLLVAHPVAWPDRARWTGPLGAAVRRISAEPLVRPPSSVGAAAGPRAGRCRPTTNMRPSPRPPVRRWYNVPAETTGLVGFSSRGLRWQALQVSGKSAPAICRHPGSIALGPEPPPQAQGRPVRARSSQTSTPRPPCHRQAIASACWPSLIAPNSWPKRGCDRAALLYPGVFARNFLEARCCSTEF